MLFMVENGIRGGICQPIHRYAKANNKYMKSYDKNIEYIQMYIQMQTYLIYLDANNLYGGEMKNFLQMVLIW